MESKFVPQKYEEKIYRFWEKNGFFRAKVNPPAGGKKPFSIILPPPNANADLHLGHAMYVYEDIIIRYHKLLGDEILWLPGADHAGFETQYVFEKELKKQGKSRFDFDSKVFYKMIWDFVMKNKKNMEDQLRRLGFALDWSKKKFTLDKDIVRIVKQTFKKLYDENLVYYQKAIVNYCVHCGTSFSDLEVIYKEKKGKLWYIKYPFVNNKNKFITVATTRPETMLGDMAVAVNPKDKRYKKFIGKIIILPIVNRAIEIIADSVVDPKFGTGAVKVTPAHDPTDWEIAKRHNLDLRQVIDMEGKMTILTPDEFHGKTVYQARALVLEKLKEDFLAKEIDYIHRVGSCYKCGSVIEPIPMEQWFIRVKPLAIKAKKLITDEEIKIYPKRFKKILIWWLNNFHDWNISRQIVWGITIPAYYCNGCKKWFVSVDDPEQCPYCGEKHFVGVSDTFDTWFSSAQWPYATLTTVRNGRDRSLQENEFFNYFYPTSVMETGYDILPWWVARMIMIGCFATKKAPFKNIFLHGLVRDKKGQKMSKSKGNVINPMEMINKHGADALRAALVFEVKEGNDLTLSEEKIIGMRNFTNKIWNIGRFIYINRQVKNEKLKVKSNNEKLKIIKELRKEFAQEKKKYFKFMDNYQFSKALGLIYEFLWHRFADYYIEELKNEVRNGNIKVFEEIKKVYLENLILLHPFIPFVTEAVWKIFNGEESSILCQNVLINRKN